MLREHLDASDYRDVVTKLDPMRARFVAIVRKFAYDELMKLRSEAVDCGDHVFA